MERSCLSLNQCESLTKIPGSIGQLKSVVELSLSPAGVGKLPDSVGNLSKFEVLDFNNINGTDLPGAVRMLEKL